jgi:hypothetical protein
MALALAKTDPTPTPRRARKSRASSKVLPFPAPSEKSCRTCGTEKALGKFHKHGSSKDGHRHDCKDCVASARASKAAGQVKATPLPAKPYEPTAPERQIVEKYYDQKEQRPAPPLKVAVADGVATISSDHPDPVVGSLCSMTAIGTAQGHFYIGLISQLADLGLNDEAKTNFALSIVYGIRPRDEAEAVLAAQFAAAHIVTMRAAQRLAKCETIQQQDSVARMFNQCSRTCVALVEGLKRYRSSGEQNIKVQHQHVTVSDGGQAIVAGSMQAGGV